MDFSEISSLFLLANENLIQTNRFVLMPQIKLLDVAVNENMETGKIIMRHFNFFQIHFNDVGRGGGAPRRKNSILYPPPHTHTLPT